MTPAHAQLTLQTDFFFSPSRLTFFSPASLSQCFASRLNDYSRKKVLNVSLAWLATSRVVSASCERRVADNLVSWLSRAIINSETNSSPSLQTCSCSLFYSSAFRTLAMQRRKILLTPERGASLIFLSPLWSCCQCQTENCRDRPKMEENGNRKPPLRCERDGGMPKQRLHG